MTWIYIPICMYVSTYTGVYICVYKKHVYMCVCTCAQMCTLLYLHAYVCVYCVHIYVCAFFECGCIHMCIFTSTFVRIQVYMHLYLCVLVCICAWSVTTTWVKRLIISNTPEDSVYPSLVSITLCFPSRGKSYSDLGLLVLEPPLSGSYIM